MKGYKSPLEPDYLGELPEEERSVKYYKEFVKIYQDLDVRTAYSNIIVFYDIRYYNY